MDYSTLSDEELKELLHKYTNETSAYHNEQMAIKILLNALYGQLSNKFCRWFDIRLPRSITCTGQTLIRYIARKLNELLNEECETNNVDYVLAIDTDSNYLNLDGVYKKKGYKNLDELNDYIVNVLEPYIDKCYREFYDYMNHFDFQMVMKREAISDRGIFIHKKRRYCLSVIDMEGVRYAQPELKIMGFEVIKSSTPEGVKDALKKVFKILLYQTKADLVHYIDEFKEEFMKMSPDRIAIVKKVSDIEKWLTPRYATNARTGKEYKLGIPINTQSAINFNKLVDLEKIDTQKIEVGDKVKYVYLKENPYGFETLGFIDYLPEELGMHQYIDYNKQFEKVFVQNVKIITDDFGYDLNLADDMNELLDDLI